METKANRLRTHVIEMLLAAGSGHTAGPLGLADIFTVLYFMILNHDPANPDKKDRDRLILSNGHCVPIQYAAMAEAGYFPRAELKTLRKFGSRLQGHPERERLPGLETTSGPLGSGLSQAAGMAYGLRLSGNKKSRVFCVTSDGEHEEGNIWEAIMFAAKNKLSNLTVILDRNHIQIDGPTEQVMPLESIVLKYQAFNWHVIEIDGHNFEQIISACNEARAIAEQPTLILAHTIPGKGVDFIESDFHWHGYDPNSDRAKADYRKALSELRSYKGQIRGEHE